MEREMDPRIPEVLVLPFPGQGHLFPCIELCKHIVSRNLRATLVAHASLTLSLPHRHPLLSVVQFPPSDPRPGNHDPGRQSDEISAALPAFLAARPAVACAVLDVMMTWSRPIFAESAIPVVSFFTSGAASAAVEYAAWKVHSLDMKPGEIRLLPGLPDDMALSYSDLKHRLPPAPPKPNGGGKMPMPHIPPEHTDPIRFHPVGGGPPKPGEESMLHIPPDKSDPTIFHPFGGPGPFKAPPKLGDEPMWWHAIEGSVALLFNTCDDIERPFLEYIAGRIGKPVWGIGPLLPEQFWSSFGSVFHDSGVRSARKSNYTEDEVVEWLDSKPPRSVLYVSFGSELSPNPEEIVQLAAALEASGRFFIWAIQTKRPGPPGHEFSEAEAEADAAALDGLADRVGVRGLIVRGWAPQLLILSHPSTAGFLSHCGWNSTVEALGRGVPLLSWPLRGDQYYNTKLVVGHLKVGHVVSDGDLTETIGKEDIGKGIERVMTDDGTAKRAAMMREAFQGGFPVSSVASLDSFGDFIKQELVKSGGL